MIGFWFRGLFRDKSRFIFPFTVVAVGVALVIALVGFMEGVFMGMIDMTANFDSGHLRLVNRLYYDEEHLRPLDRALANQRETRDWLAKHSAPDMNWSPRIRWGAILDVPDEQGETRSQTPVVGMAMDLKSPDSKEISRLHLKSSLIKGALPKGSNEMLMGIQLAEVLGISVGQTVTLIGQSFDGGLVTDNYQIAGLVRFGIAAMDKKMVLVDLADAQNTFYMEDMVTDWLRKIVSEQVSAVVGGVELSGPRSPVEADGISEPGGVDLLAAAIGAISHNRSASWILLLADVAARPQREVHPAVGPEPKGAGPMASVG